MAHHNSFSKDTGLLDLLLAQRKMSRRTLLGGLAGLTLTGGSITSCSSPPNLSLASHTPTSPSQTVLYTYRGHSVTVSSVAWSPDGKRIASGSSDKTVQVWDAVDGSHVYTYRGHSDLVWTVAWSPDSKRIASGSSDKTVQVWRV
jgi:WD40 repeat protein